MKTRNSASRLLFLLAATAGLAGTSPWAAATTPPESAPLSTFAPPANDPALGMLGKLTGDIGGLGFFPGGLNADVTSMFTVFNTAVIAVAAIFFMWNMLSATLQGAHDGEFLGKRYHSYWMPLRTFTGIFFLMPLFAGWSAAQVFMAWAAWGGTGIANHVAGASTSIIQMQTAQYVAMPPTPDMRPVVNDLNALYEKVISYKQAQLARTSSGITSSTDPFVGLNFDATFTTDTDRIRVAAGVSPGSFGFGPDSIGSYEYAISGADSSYVKSQTIKDAYVAAVKEVIRDADAEIHGYADRLGAVDQYSAAFYSINGDYKAALLTLPSRMQRQITTRLEAARQVAQALPATTTAGASFSSSYGWIGAGLGIVDGTLISYEAASLSGKGNSTSGSAALPDTAGTTSAALSNADPTKLKAAADRLKTQAATDKAEANRARAAGQYDDASFAQELGLSNDQVDSNYTRTESSSSFFGSISDAISDAKASLSKVANFSLADWINEKMRSVVSFIAAKVTAMMNAQTNPIAAMQNLGLGIVGAIGLIFAMFGIFAGIGMGISFATGLFGGVGGFLGGALSALAFIFITIIAPLAFFAMKLVGVLPFTPVIMWIGSVVNYFVIFIESLFGAQLWGLVHLDPDGEGMGQRTTHGYVFLLNLLFRPAMMVICLAIGYSLLNVAGGLGIAALGNVLTQVTSNPSNGWIMPLMMTIACIWVFVSLMETLIHTCMSIVNVVPGQVITWIGGTFGSNVGTDLDRGVQQGAQGMAGATGSATGQMGQAGLSRTGTAADNMRTNRTLPVRNEDGTVGSQSVSASAAEMRGAKGAVRGRDLQDALSRNPSRPQGSTRPPQAPAPKGPTGGGGSMGRSDG